MLRLLGTPHWRTPDAQHELPNTLPGWTIAFLAVKGDWVSRDHLLALLWPDAAAAEAQHSLRVNLHRARGVLASWGLTEALQAERKRVRLQLPSDVDELRRSLNRVQVRSLMEIYRQPLLASLTIPAFPALQEWLELERASLHTAWRESLLSHLDESGLAPADTLASCQAMLAADPLDEEALARQMQCLDRMGRAGEAIHLYDAFQARLAQDQAVEPSPMLQALATGLAGQAATPGGAAAPTRDAFIGRDLELEQLASMVAAAEGRVITVLGPGGVGKSRVARELLRRLAGRWPEAPAWVALGDLTASVDMLPRLAESIGLGLTPSRDPQSQLVQALAVRQGLIVLDNAEHLSDLPTRLATLQQAAPAVRWLVTSRSPLALPGERCYTLEGLARPNAAEAAPGLEKGRTFDAVRLLEARARALDPAFDLAEQWPECLALIEAVGGWPLALELAASALVHIDAAALLADLRLGIDTLAAGRPPEKARHASLRASLDLSWRLLAPTEQTALARLSVFRGGFRRAAALAVADTGAASLATLLERSLVHVAGHGRFELHPLVAQFAVERLDEDEAVRAAARRCHGDHFSARLRACAEPEVAGSGAMLDEIAADFENFRTAWLWLLEQRDARRLGQCAAAWVEFGAAKGRASELAQLVAAAMPATVLDMQARASLLQAAASLRFRAGELDLAQALARDGLQAAAAVGDDASERALLSTLALALKDLGRYDEAEQFAQDGLRRARAAKAEREVAAHANTCAILAKTRGDQAGAAALYEEAIAIHRRSANHRSLAMCLNNLGNTLRALGDLQAAQRHFEESLRTAEQHGIASTRAFALVNLAIVHHQSGHQALAESFAQRARKEPAAEPSVLLAVDAVMVRAALDRRDFDRARVELGALARRARQTGLHAALLEAVASHAKLLAGLGERDGAIARLLYLAQNPQLPAIQRSDVEQVLRSLGPKPDEQVRAERLAGGYELESLIESAAAGG
jgi:predicted ATPase/DNA-binding SARP family transcriptional activator